MGLEFTDAELAEARKTNRFLSWMPRFRPRGRRKAALMQGLLRAKQLWPSRQLEGLGIRAETRQVQDEGRSVAIRVLHPKGSAQGVYFDIHGGAWIVGNAKADDPINGLIASECSMVVVSVDYRLALDSRLDLSIADCETAARWLVRNCIREFGTDNIIIGGESAGAHLAACALLALRDREEAVGKIVGAVLFYGVYDMSGSASLRSAGSDTVVLHGPSTFKNLLRLTPDRTEEERRKPDISPLYADLRGLPPALFLAGTLDPLIDDTLQMAERWQTVNGNAELVVVPEAPHAFNRLGTAMAGRTNAYVRRWIRRLARQPTPAEAAGARHCR